MGFASGCSILTGPGGAQVFTECKEKTEFEMAACFSVQP